MKRFVLFFFCALICSTVIAQKVKIEGVTYIIVGSHALISEVDKKLSEIRIYGIIEYKGQKYKVTGTSRRNYYYCGWNINSPFSKSSNLKSIIVDETFETIGNDLFRYLTNNVKTIKLPSTLKSIESSAFSHCSGLESIVIPKGIKKNRRVYIFRMYFIARSLHSFICLFYW